MSIVSSETIYLEHCREELASLFIPLWHDPDLDCEQPGPESPARMRTIRVTLGTVHADLWPIFKQNNFQVILSDPITKPWVSTKVSACIHCIKVALYTADMPAIVKGGDVYFQCLVLYADDLAICSVQQYLCHTTIYRSLLQILS